jgi:hypothetical protein
VVVGRLIEYHDTREHMSIQQRIQVYHGDIERDGHHRYRSWEHCYAFFHRNAPENLVAQREAAALQLGFYLASWGMYRGSSFLLQHAYTIHFGVIDVLARPEFTPLWETDFGATKEDACLTPVIMSAVQAVHEAYTPFGQPTDTLVTKVILGTFGCLPACDRYFISGFKLQGFQYSYLNPRFIERVRLFCLEYLPALRSEQLRIADRTGSHYPLMKLVDMYFWQIGYEADTVRESPPGDE